MKGSAERVALATAWLVAGRVYAALCALLAIWLLTGYLSLADLGRFTFYLAAFAVLDAVVDMEEQLLIWRHRHMRMVERTIGRRVGTGGSDGVSYLEKTLRYRTFQDLWSIRTVMLPKRALPALANPDFYGFA